MTFGITSNSTVFQQHIQASTNEDIRLYWSYVRWIHGQYVDSYKKGSVMRKRLPYDICWELSQTGLEWNIQNSMRSRLYEWFQSFKSHQLFPEHSIEVATLEKFSYGLPVTGQFSNVYTRPMTLNIINSSSADVGIPQINSAQLGLMRPMSVSPTSRLKATAPP